MPLPARCRGRPSGGRWLTTCSPPSKIWKPTASTTSAVGPLVLLVPAPLHPAFMYVVFIIPFARWGPGEGSGWSSLRTPKFKKVELPGIAADISAVDIYWRFLPRTFSSEFLITSLRSPAHFPHPLPWQMAEEEAADIMLALVRYMGGWATTGASTQRVWFPSSSALGCTRCYCGDPRS